MQREEQGTRQIRHARTRDEILRAAREVVLDKGIDSFSLREVARRVDYSPAGLYEYFSGREEILEELAQLAMDGLSRAMNESAAENPENRLLAIGLGYIRFGIEHSQDYLLLFTRKRSHRSALQSAPDEGNPYMIVAEAVRTRLAESKRHLSGEIEEAHAFGYWALAHGQVMLRLTHLKNFDADFELAAEHTLQAYIDGLAT